MRRIRWNRLVLFAGILLFTGCGNCGDEPAQQKDKDGGGGPVGDILLDAADGMGPGDGQTDNPDGDAQTSVVDATDGGGSGTDGGGSNMSDADGSTVQCKNVDTWTSRQHCGSCGNACTGEQICNNGACKCPDYHTFCSGKCVATNLDPDHCGSCTNSCTSGQVCNGGRCVTDCPTGMTECNGRCVDTSTNDQNCGSCGNACGSGKGCSYGRCVDQVQVGSPPAKCAGGGPPIDIGFTQNNMNKKCSGKVAKTTFKWGMCSCDDVSFGQEFVVDAYDSSKGPYSKHGYGGGVGSNGKISLGKGRIWGALWTSSPKGIDGDVELAVKQQVHSQGDYDLAMNGGVKGDAWVGGHVTYSKPGGPAYPFDKTLHIPRGNNIHQRANPNNISRQPVNVSTVCKRCQSGNQIPVRQIVKNHQGSMNNDNQAIGLNEKALIDPGKEMSLKLPCGKYYLSGVRSGSKVTITATGRTALFIDGDIDVSDIIIKPTPSAQLDVFVNGKVTFKAGNAMKIGSPAYPASMRFYVNGKWTFRNNGTIGAYIYAIPGGITATMNNLEIYGGVYTQNFDTMNNLRVHYDREVLRADKKCPKPNPNPDPDPDAGMGGPDGMTSDSGGTPKMDSGGSSKMDSGGSSKMDSGGSGPTCSEAGGSCSSDGDCCSPLVCNSGTCDTSSCQALNESCSSDSECCSGNCADSFNICTGT